MHRSASRRGAAIALSLLAVLGGCRDQAPVRPSSVAISLSAFSLFVGPSGGGTQQLTATALDADGDPLRKIPVTWSVTGPPYVSVSANGLVKALAVGTTYLRATAHDKFVEATVFVSPVPAAQVTLSFDTVSLERSPYGVQTHQASASARDSLGALLSNFPLIWYSDNPAVASVSLSGLITATGNGTTKVHAVSGTRSDSATVSVSTTAGFPASGDVAITSVRWTQGAQDSEGSIPMIRNGRDAAVVVATTSNLDPWLPLEFELRLFDAANTLVWADTISKLVPLGDKTHATSYVQFLVPSAQLQPGLKWQVVRDPTGSVGDANASNDRYPAATPALLNMITPPPLRLRFAAISLSQHGLLTATLDSVRIQQYLNLFRAIIPHGEFEWSVAPTIVSDVHFGAPPNGGAGQAFWTALLPQIDAARLADAEYADAHWIGVVSPPVGYTYINNGGWAYIPFNGASYGPGTRTFGMVRVGWATDETYAPTIFAHELGHNLGRFHAPCGGASGTDPLFPNISGTIGEGAHNTYWWEAGVNFAAVPMATSLGDIMGYCRPSWISAYTYRAMLNFRGSIDAAVMAPRERGPVMLVQGEVAGASPSISAIQRLTAEASPNDPMGSWRLELLDAGGTLLHSQRFEPTRWAHDASTRPFGVAVPLNATLESLAARVRVTGPGGTSTQRSLDR